MRRRHLVVLLALALSPPSAAQQAKQSARIGFLAFSSEENARARLAALRRGLRELGYMEGQNLRIEPRYAAGQAQDLARLAQELVDAPVDILVTEGTPAARAAQKASSRLPVVMGNAGDPVATGLVASLAKPGGNLTGMSDFSLDLVSKRLQLLKELVVSARSVAVLVNPANPTNPLELHELQATATRLGMTLRPFEVSNAADLELSFTAIRQDKPDCLLVAGDALFGTLRTRIIAFAGDSRLPALYPSSTYVEAGGLLSYGANFADLFRRAATYVDKILKGAKPSDLPIEQPVQFELAINLGGAQGLGLKIPSTLLTRAEMVIE